MRFAVLNASCIPSFVLASTCRLRPPQFGDTLRWIAIPQFPFAPCVALRLQRYEPRWPIVIGLVMVALAGARIGTTLKPPRVP